MNEDIEQQVMDSSIDDELRSEISQAKEKKSPIPMMYVYIGIGLVALIALALVLFFFVIPHNQETTFSFYFNKKLVTQDLLVNVSFADIDQDYNTDKETLILLLPKNIEVTLDVKTPGYQAKKKFIINKEDFRFDIEKTTVFAQPNTDQTNVRISIYDSTNMTTYYLNDVQLNLSCSGSNKTETIIVKGIIDYKKDYDCQSLTINTKVAGFVDYSKVCHAADCRVELKKAVETKPTGLTNNLIVTTIDSSSGKTISNVDLTLDNIVKLTGKTDVNGKYVFMNLSEGKYSLQAQTTYEEKLYTAPIDNNVVITAQAAAITKTIYFRFSDENTMSFFIDANADYKCKFAIEVFDSNTRILELYNMDANKEVVADFEDIKEGKYLMSVFPYNDDDLELDVDEIRYDCTKIYAPIYNESIDYKAKTLKEIKMLKISQDGFVFLTVKPRLFGIPIQKAKVKVREASNNIFILDTETNNEGNAGEFVLKQDKNYFISVEDSALFGEAYYLYKKAGKTKGDDNFYHDAITIDLNVAAVDVNFNVQLDNEDVNFTVNAMWKDPMQNYKEVNFYFPGFNGKAQAKVIAGQDILFKVSIEKKYEQGLDDALSFVYNYYLENKVFSSNTNHTIDLNLSFSDTINKGMISNEKFYLNNKIIDSESLNANNVKGNKEYYLAFDVLAKDINNLCLGNSKGFVFSAQDDKEHFNVDNISLYSFEEVIRSTLGYKFKLAKINKSNEFDIFRVVVKIKVGDFDNGKYNLGFANDFTASYSNNFITFDLVEKESVKLDLEQTNILNLNINENNNSNISLNLPKDYLSALRNLNYEYIVQDVNWISYNSMPNCDTSANIDLLTKVFELDSLNGKELNLDDGTISSEIRSNSNILDSINLSRIYDLKMNFDLNNISKTNSVSNYTLPITIKINNNKTALLDCFNVTYNGTKLKYVKDNLNNDYFYFSNSGYELINATSVSDVLFNKRRSNKLWISNYCDSIVGINLRIVINDSINETFFTDSNEFGFNSDFSAKQIHLELFNENSDFNLGYNLILPDSVEFDNWGSLGKPFEKIPLIEYNDVNPDCSDKLCSRQILLKNKYLAEGNYYLSDDNYIDYYGTEYWQDFVPGVINISDSITKIRNLDDQIFYYMPFKIDDSIGQNYYANLKIGSCTTSPGLKLADKESATYTACSNSFVGYYTINNTINGFSKENLAKVVDSKIINHEINFNSYPGFNSKICNVMTSCIGENTLENILNNNVQDELYYALVDGKYYDLNNLFYISEDSLFPAFSDISYSIIKFSKPTTTGILASFKPFNLSKGTQSFYLNSMILAYNSGFIKSLNLRDNYNYVWDFGKIATYINETSYSDLLLPDPISLIDPVTHNSLFR